MNNNQIKNDNEKEKQQKIDEIIAKESPELLLNLKQFETEPKLCLPLVSDPVKLILFVTLIDIVAAAILSFLKNKSYFLILGSAGLWVSIPWWLAFLDGLIFIGYGVYVVKNRKGQIDFSSSSGEKFAVTEMKGESASFLGVIYILLGIFLLIATLMQFFIK